MQASTTFIKSAVCAAIMSSFVGCATETNTKPASTEEKQIVTGSNIPRKDRSAVGTKVIDKEAIERATVGGGTGGKAGASDK